VSAYTLGSTGPRNNQAMIVTIPLHQVICATSLPGSQIALALASYHICPGTPIKHQVRSLSFIGPQCHFPFVALSVVAAPSNADDVGEAAATGAGLKL